MDHRPKVIGVVALCLVAWLIWEQFRETPFIVSGFIEADQIRTSIVLGIFICGTRVEPVID